MTNWEAAKRLIRPEALAEAEAWYARQEPEVQRTIDDFPPGVHLQTPIEDEQVTVYVIGYTYVDVGHMHLVVSRHHPHTDLEKAQRDSFEVCTRTCSVPKLLKQPPTH